MKKIILVVILTLIAFIHGSIQNDFTLGFIYGVPVFLISTIATLAIESMYNNLLHFLQSAKKRKFLVLKLVVLKKMPYLIFIITYFIVTLTSDSFIFGFGCASLSTLIYTVIIFTIFEACKTVSRVRQIIA